MCSVFYYVLSLQQLIYILRDELGERGGFSRQYTRLFLTVNDKMNTNLLTIIEDCLDGKSLPLIVVCSLLAQ